jgi:hypothetical protein
MIKYPYDSTYWTYLRNLEGTESRNSEIPLGTEYTAANRTLTIPYATKNHAGKYSCVAKVNATEVRDSVYIEVAHEAEITESLEDSKKKNTYLL